MKKYERPHKIGTLASFYGWKQHAYVPTSTSLLAILRIYLEFRNPTKSKRSGHIQNCRIASSTLQVIEKEISHHCFLTFMAGVLSLANRVSTMVLMTKFAENLPALSYSVTTAKLLWLSFQPPQIILLIQF